MIPEQTNSDQLTVENSMDMLIVLLYAPGKSGVVESVKGITRLQKLMFLLAQGVGPGQLVKEAISYGYRPYKMGPYSVELSNDIEELKSAGIIVTKALQYWISDDADDSEESDDDLEILGVRKKRVESQEYSLSTNLGRQVGSELWKSLTDDQQIGLREFKEFFNSLSLRQLLIFTYERFPEFTTESTIKQELGLA